MTKEQAKDILESCYQSAGFGPVYATGFALTNLNAVEDDDREENIVYWAKNIAKEDYKRACSEIRDIFFAAYRNHGICWDRSMDLTETDDMTTIIIQGLREDIQFDTWETEAERAAEIEVDNILEEEGDDRYYLDNEGEIDIFDEVRESSEKDIF